MIIVGSSPSVHPLIAFECRETGKTAKSFEYGKCPETGKQQNLSVGPKSLPTGGHRTTLFGKSLETGKQQNLLVGPKSLPTGGHRTIF